jgi:hypothetical protein
VPLGPFLGTAHMTVNGASLRTGDLFASGAVSGPGKDQRGSFIELTWGGKDPLTLPDGSTRTFLRDGDTVTITATATATAIAPGPDGTRMPSASHRPRRGRQSLGCPPWGARQGALGKAVASRATAQARSSVELRVERRQPR